ncbi:hypothetical protein RND71_025009 [Anisodus tanguticus]|uniref:MLO-like protein n=1 Tax=Anisodus tanguticus TaxID=243964 RepID=A0AAE1RQL7_9SOLA|nr:hypothetical protein RND71_025009 [Anisodus tanguticus]
MAKERSMEATPTWAVAAVCFILLAISIFIEQILHHLGEWLLKKHKKPLYEALEKIKAELMLLGFISLLLTVVQTPVSNLCVPKSVGYSWHPCKTDEDDKSKYDDPCLEKGKVQFASSYAIHQLHIFIFVLAVAHVLYCIATFAFGRLKVSFFRQFFSSVPKVDYLTLRHGFMMIILLVGTKLQMIITEMGVRISERGDIVKGVPVVETGDHLFWFNRPGLVLFLVNFVLFQNAFQVAFFAWSWWKFGFPSCFHKNPADLAIRLTMGVIIQVHCSYVTLPLYALVTQMGSSMKPIIFGDNVATALRSWHSMAKKRVKQGQLSPVSSRPATPLHGSSPVHLLRGYPQYNEDSVQASPRTSNVENEGWANEISTSPHTRNGNKDDQEGQIPHASTSMQRPHPDQHQVEITSSDFTFGNNLIN